MSLAWQVSDEDVVNVLAAHGVTASIDSDLVTRALAEVRAQGERVENAALYGDDLDQQAAIASSEIEDILMEQGVIGNDKKFSYR